MNDMRYVVPLYFVMRSRNSHSTSIYNICCSFGGLFFSAEIPIGLPSEVSCAVKGISGCGRGIRRIFKVQGFIIPAPFCAVCARAARSIYAGRHWMPRALRQHILTAERTGGMYMSLISVNHLTFYYEGSSDYIFEDVSFQMDTDWKLGFVARNGRGKTTFLKLLMGKYEYRGSITSSEKFDYFPFPVKDRDKNTMDIVDELFPENEFWKICRELTMLQVEADVLYRPFSTLSNGEQTKLMLAVLFSMDHRFLLIDEPTNHLDQQARKIVKEYLNGKKGFLLVSHDRDFLDQCVDHILVINKTSIEVYQGNFSIWWEQKKRQDAFEQAESERLKKDIRRLTESAREKAKWADDVEATKIGRKSSIHEKNIDMRAYIGEKSRRMQKRRKNLEHRQEKEIEEKAKLLKNIESAEELKLFPLCHHKQVLVELEDLQVYYEQPPKYLKKMNFKIENGDCVVLQGRNGCGKSSVIKAILQDQSVSYTGRLSTASGLVISYVSQDTSFLKGSLMDYAEAKGLNLTLFMALLRKLDFGREQFEKNMEDYSGGQKKKVLIAASLCEKAHLYIWDEPLNFIDVFSRMQIEDLILAFRPTMLVVEHDETFVDKIGTKIILCE